MRTTLRIPCREPYAYLEVEISSDITPAEIKETYDMYYSAMNEKEKDISTYLIELFDSNLKTWGSPEDYAELPAKQQEVLQAIKRYVKRIK